MLRLSPRERKHKLAIAGYFSNSLARDTTCLRIWSSAGLSRSQMAKTASAKALSEIGRLGTPPTVVSSLPPGTHRRTQSCPAFVAPK